LVVELRRGLSPWSEQSTLKKCEAKIENGRHLRSSIWCYKRQLKKIKRYSIVNAI
jgi:hypothetical protein